MKPWATPQTMREHAAADRRYAALHASGLPVLYARWLAARDGIDVTSYKVPEYDSAAHRVRFGDTFIAIPNPEPAPNGGLVEHTVDGVPVTPVTAETPVTVRQHKSGGGDRAADWSPMITTYRVYFNGRLVDSFLSKSLAMKKAKSLGEATYEPNLLAAYMPAKAAALRHAEYAGC